MDRVPNRGRDVPAGEEARRIEVEKKAAKEPAKHRPKPPVKAVRLKVVWEVCSGTGKAVKTFPYAEKAAAEAQTRALTKSTGRAHVLRATKVPMD